MIERAALALLRWVRGDDNRYLLLSPSPRRLPTLALYFYMLNGRAVAVRLHRKPYEYRWASTLADRLTAVRI